MKYAKTKLLAALACLLFAYTEAAVLRLESGEDTNEESTTLPALDELATTTTAATIEDATDRMAVASLDPAPGTLDDVEVHLDVGNVNKLEKSANLLLLSTPKLTGKRLELAVEEDDDDIESAGNLETTATPPKDAEVTTVSTEEVTESNKATNTNGTTKLFAVNETFTEEQRRSVNGTLDQSPSVVAVEAPVVHNDNAAAAVLTEHEADYLLVDADLDADIEEFGSFTHADSEVHLQPIVQSVEIVPTSFDDPLIVNFVHQL